MAITLRQLEAFAAVCKEGSFSKAAQRIHISQSGLSVLIRDLEDNLGAKLFDRNTRQIALTDAGHEFSAPAARILADLQNATHHIKGLASRQHGRVTVAAPPLLAGQLVVEIAARFRQRHPGIALHIQDIPSESILDVLAQGQADLAIGTFANAPECQVYPLLSGPPLVLVPKHFPLASQSSLSWAELAAQPLVAPTRENAFRQFIDRGFAQLGLHPSVVTEVMQLSTVISLVEAGFGVAALPPHSALAPAGNKTVALTLRQPDTVLDIVMVHDRFRTPSAAVEAFMEVARQVVRPAQ